MKKTALIIGLLLVFSFLVGCGGTKSEAIQSEEPAEEVAAKENSKGEILPLEVKEFSYTLSNNYLYYALVIHNPNDTVAYDYPSYRVTARDKDNIIIDTYEHTLSIVYPGQDFYYANEAFECTVEPASVTVELLSPEEWNIRDVSSLSHPEYTPLTAINTAMRNDNIVGEIQNDNDFDLSDAVVSVFFYDEGGNLIAGTSSFASDVKAGTTTPFSVMIYQEFATENYKVFANIWG